MLDKIAIILTDHPGLKKLDKKLDKKLCDMQMTVYNRYRLLCIIANQEEMEHLLQLQKER